MKLYIVRHGDTIGTVVKKYHGHTDVVLDKKGVGQVRRMARYLKDVKFTAAYSSDLMRCSETAKMILGRRRLKLKCKKGLREIDFGKWEGMTFDEMQADDCCLFEKWFHNLPKFVMPGGESTKGMAERINNEIASIAKKHKDGNILVVTHGGPIRVVLCNVLNISMQKFWHMSIDPASLSIVDYCNGYPMIRLVNFTA